MLCGSSPFCAQRQKASKVGTVAGETVYSPEDLCSTPKGIKGWDRAEQVELSRTSLPSAQRQKASKVGTGILAKAGALSFFVCSTPKGIKGWDRFSTFFIVPLCDTVLNAKRHQRLGQFVSGYPMFRVVSCAQRQKASKVGTARLARLLR